MVPKYRWKARQLANPNPPIRQVEAGRARDLALLRRTRLDPGGARVGVGLALPSSGPAEMRERQAVPLRRSGYRRIGAKANQLTPLKQVNKIGVVKLW
jgi:hypothetical protein